MWRIFKIIFSALLTLPIVFWLQPPFYAVFAMSVLVALIVDAGLGAPK